MGGDGQRCEITVWGLPPMWSEEAVEAFFARGRCSSHEDDVLYVVRFTDRATVVFDSKQNAQLAVEELNGLDLGDDGGGVLQCEIKGSSAKSVVRPTCAPHLASATQSTTKTSSKLDEGDYSESSVQLRGLPFRAKVADVEVFLGEHVEDLAIDGEPAVRLLLSRDGRPSGFAHVRFNSPDAAHACCASLHLQEMDSRYVEVLPWSKKAGKSRRQSKFDVDELMSEGHRFDVTGALDDEFAREQVLQDVRKFVSQPGRHLLSTLGAVLSPRARTYLRASKLGMKHFLARFPAEFRVEGTHGSERVLWLLGEDGSPVVDDDMPPTDFQEPLVETTEPAKPLLEAPRPTQAPRITRAHPDKSRETPKRSHAHLDPESHPYIEVGEELPMVRLRGLPFSITAQEVLDFFAQHGVEDSVTEGVEAVELLIKANGRPSGQAAVHVRSHDDAEHVQQILNKQFVGDRYIEVFAYGDEGVEAANPKGPRKRRRSI